MTKYGTPLFVIRRSGFGLFVRYLGIDYGEKRIGLACSDTAGRLAFPYGVVTDLDGVVGVIARQQVGAVVIGLPLTAGQQESATAEAVRSFARALGRRVPLPIAFENELFTTKIAEQHSAPGAADASAAAIILQSYLDRKKSEARNSKSETNPNAPNQKF